MPTPAWRRYLRFWRANVRADIDDELRFHLGERIEELTAAGVSPDEAKRQAIAELGDVSGVAAALREIDERVQRSRGSSEWFDRVARDVRYALRGFRRAPVVTATIVVTLALGVGANVAVLSLADRLFVRPPGGVTRPDELRRVYTRSTWSAGQVLQIHSAIGYPQFGVVAASADQRAKFTAYTAPDSVVVGRADDRSVVLGSYVDASFFPTLGVTIERGRPFAPNEVRFGNPAFVAVISDAYWHDHFGGDGDIVGREVRFNRQRYTIIGIAGRGFRGTDLNATDVWLPISDVTDSPQHPWSTGWRRAPGVRVVARVAAGNSDASLAAAATAAFRNGELEHEADNPDTATVILGPILESVGPSIQPKTEVAIVSRLLGVAIVLLLVACANVANLLLARAVSRRREVAVRLALGVSRGRLLMQLLVESVTLSLVAGAIAAAFALWCGPALAHLILPDKRLGGAALDWRTAVATFAISIVTGVLTGIAPALHARRSDVASALKAGVRGRAAAASRLRPVFVVAQTALSLVLIVGAGLFAKSLEDVKGIDVGYDVDRLAFGAVFFVNDSTNTIDYFGETHRAETAAGLRTALAEMARSPGVEGAALTTHPPLGGYTMIGLFTDSGAVPEINHRDATARATTPSFFATSGLELRRGRLYNDADDAGAPPVVVVSETAARVYWPGRDALGQCLHFIKTTAPCTRVIGVTRDSHLDQLIEGDAVAESFLPVAQQKGFFGRPAYLLVRAAPGQVARVTTKLRSVLRTIFPAAEPPYVKTVSSLVEPELRPWRLGATLFGVFGALALLVAAIGVYSAMAYSVSERIGELGIRAALGASGANILSLIVGDAARIVGAGIICGLVLSLAGGRVVASLLYATSPRDPVVLGLGAITLAILAIGSSAIPAWRAARADPMSALRAD